MNAEHEYIAPPFELALLLMKLEESTVKNEHHLLT